MDSKKPKITIITVCYNEKNLDRTLKSIVNQTFQNFEWIVMDGGSDKPTIDTFEKYKDRIDVFISKKDNGIYDAMNKAIELSKGEWLIFMNAGDTFYENNSLEKICTNHKNAFKKNDILYCDSLYHNKDNSSYIPKFPNKIKEEFWKRSCLSHQSTFIKKELFEKYGNYDEFYKISADLEKWLCFQNAGCKFKHIKEIVSNYYVDGLSSNAKGREYERKLILDKYFNKQRRPIYRIALIRDFKIYIKHFIEKFKIDTNNFIDKSAISEFSKKISASNKKEGCIVFANGPDLKDTLNDEKTLSFIQNKKKFCTNNFPATEYFYKLKPEFIVFMDPFFWAKDLYEEKRNSYQKIYENLMQTDWQITIFMPKAAQNWNFFIDLPMKNENIDIIYVNASENKYKGKTEFREYALNLAMPNVLNVTISALFLGINLGFEKIHLYGANHSNITDIKVEENILYEIKKYFYEDKMYENLTPCYSTPDRKKTKTISEFLYDWYLTFSAYEKLEEYSKYMGAKIYNLSKNSFIDAFERKIEG